MKRLLDSDKTIGRAGGHGNLARQAAWLGAFLGAATLTTQRAAAEADHHPDKDDGVATVFVIAMENHNFTQPNPTSSPQQILGNPAAPYINSLITPGNPNAAEVSFATAYENAGTGVHPSEPNYVWAEAGTDFGVHTDADPRPANGNTFYNRSLHLTALMSAAGVSWKNYQEDVQLSVSPTNSASGTTGPVNPYYGTTQFNYAVKHNPMAFFADTAVKNVFPLSQLFQDLANGAVGRYNWITPNQFDDAHSALTGGFTYLGTAYTGDQAAVAQGDNFLSQVVPEIMATPGYKHNGVIIIWWDESEQGDDTNHTIPSIIISPLAKGNAYSNAVPLNHSSDIKTMSEIFGLPYVNHLIPTAETNNAGEYNNVATVNDLSDLFLPGSIPPAPSLTVTSGRFYEDGKSPEVNQMVRVTNTGETPAPGRVWLILENLSPNATLLNEDGVSMALPPLGSPDVSLPVSFGESLKPHESVVVQLQFLDPSGEPITYDAVALPLVPTP